MGTGSNTAKRGKICHACKSMQQKEDSPKNIFRRAT